VLNTLKIFNFFFSSYMQTFPWIKFYFYDFIQFPWKVEHFEISDIFWTLKWVWQKLCFLFFSKLILQKLDSECFYSWAKWYLTIQSEKLFFTGLGIEINIIYVDGTTKVVPKVVTFLSQPKTRVTFILQYGWTGCSCQLRK